MNSQVLFVPAALVAWLTILTNHGAIRAQNEATSLPEDWQSLPTSELVREAQSLETRGLLSADVLDQVHQHAATLLKDSDLAGASTADLPILEGLQQLGWKQLAAEDRQRILNQVLSRQDDWTDRPYEEIRAKVMLLNRGKQHLAAFVEARRWIEAGGSLEKAQQSAVGVEDLKRPLAAAAVEALLQGGEPIYGEFSVQWEGSVAAPATGDYRFSVSPVNINADYFGYGMRQDTKVWLANEKIISATHEEWFPVSGAIQLTEGQSIDIRMEVSIDTRLARYPHGVIHAVLLWEGPGLSRSIVPSSALRILGSDSAGLRGTYKWVSSSGPQTTVQTDPSVDFIWPLGGLARVGERIGESPQLLLLAKNRWRETVSPQKLDELEQAGQIHPLLPAATEVAGSLSTAQRAELLDVLLSRPALLTGVDPKSFWRFYRAFHVSSPEKATEAFGTWGAAHADDACEVSPGVSFWGIGQELRTTCREISVCVFHELPELAVTLQSRHLELPDGRCSLPVGYTLGYGFHTSGRLSEWLDILDSKLADPSLTGDQRVNWLLVRAHAEEIRNGPQRPYFNLAEQILNGRVWLDEAMSVATGAESKARVATELAARLTRVGKFEEARQLLANSPVPATAQAVQRLSANRTAVDRAERLFEEDRQSQAATENSN